MPSDYRCCCSNYCNSSTVVSWILSPILPRSTSMSIMGFKWWLRHIWFHLGCLLMLFPIPLHPEWSALSFITTTALIWLLIFLGLGRIGFTTSLGVMWFLFSLLLCSMLLFQPSLLLGFFPLLCHQLLDCLISCLLLLRGIFCTFGGTSVYIEWRVSISQSVLDNFLNGIIHC